MRLLDSARRWICRLRRRSSPGMGGPGLAAIPGWHASLAALRPALGALHDRWETERIVTEIERDVPALVEVLTAYAMIDLPDRTREFIRAWNRGPKALEELLVTEVGRSMLAGMVIEHARQERNRDDAA